MPDRFTDADLHAEAKREVALRRRVYPRWVADGRLTHEQADRQIALMEAIRDRFAPRPPPDLFTGTSHA